MSRLGCPTDPSQLQVVHRDPWEVFTTPADLGRR